AEGTPRRKFWPSRHESASGRRHTNGCNGRRDAKAVPARPRTDALYHMGNKIFEPERFAEMKLAIRLQLGHMRPASGHQEAGDTALSRFVNRGEGRAIRQHDIGN